MKEITIKTFEKEIAAPMAVVQFSGKGCPNCRVQEKFLTDIAAARTDIAFLKIDTSDARELTTKYDITTLPTLLFFRDGVVVGELVSLKPRVLIEKKVAEVFG